MTILDIRGLVVHRDGTLILDRLDWRVQRGEHWVILGANGSGKTSLLSALTGYLTPSAGEIELLGETYGNSDWRELRKRVGLVSSAIRQKVPDWDPAGLVVIGGKYAMLDYWGRVRRADRIEAAKVMRAAECAHLAERNWGVLSQGERQRVLIARALMARPAVLILDEPCAGLDPVAREQFLGFMQRLASRKVKGRKSKVEGRALAGKNSPTLLFVTHHVEEIVPAITHALLLREGRVTATGPAQKILTSKNLTQTFASPLRLRRNAGRWTLHRAQSQ
jgi:iron complex transport system ATP-binding protein